jgi:hypothetical protein
MPGRELEHWLDAERIVHSVHIISTDGRPGKVKKTAAGKTSGRGSKRKKSL